MKTALWIVCGVFAALWTGLAFGAAELTHWASGLIASGAGVDLAKAATEWPVPAWLAPWLDAAGLQAFQGFVVAALEGLRAAWPTIGSMVGWLVPVIWLLWALGLALLLALGGLGHWLVGRAGGLQAQPA